MAIIVGQGPINLYEGIIFSNEQVNNEDIIPQADVDIGNLLNPVEITYAGGGIPSSSGGIVFISKLAIGSTIHQDTFYQYNGVIYLATTEHTWNGTFISNNYEAQGLKFEKQVFSIDNDSTTSLTLSTSNVGQINSLTVNGLSYTENIDYTKGGTGNKTITFTEALPYEEGYGNTYLEITITTQII